MKKYNILSLVVVLCFIFYFLLFFKVENEQQTQFKTEIILFNNCSNTTTIIEHNSTNCNCNATIIEQNVTIVIHEKNFIEKKKSIEDSLREFDWKELEEFSITSDAYSRIPPSAIEKYLQILIPFVEDEPNNPPKVLNRPEPLSFDCRNTDYSDILTGEKRDKQVKIYDFIPFGLELDTLEIRLFELNGIVDKHIISESLVTHRYSRKQLFLSRNLQRFEKLGFGDKIIHFVLDDSLIHSFQKEDESKMNRQDAWALERGIRKIMWNRYVQYYGEPGDDDLLIHGDADEIPSSDYLFHLKNCVPKMLPLGTNSIFYSNNFYWIHNQQTMNFPSILTKSIANSEGGFNRKVYTPSKKITGYHLTSFLSPIGIIFKHLSLSEGGTIPANNLDYLKNPSLINDNIKKGLRGYDIKKQVYHQDNLPIPWYANSNKERFPHLFP